MFILLLCNLREDPSVSFGLLEIGAVSAVTALAFSINNFL